GRSVVDAGQAGRARGVALSRPRSLCRQGLPGHSPPQPRHGGQADPRRSCGHQTGPSVFDSIGAAQMKRPILPSAFVALAFLACNGADPTPDSDGTGGAAAAGGSVGTGGAGTGGVLGMGGAGGRVGAGGGGAPGEGGAPGS